MITNKEKKYYEVVDEAVYEYTYDNGLRLTVIPKEHFVKTFVCFGTRYGSLINKFVPYGEKEYIDVPLGIAHFLEHKMFASENGDAALEFTKLGLDVNAYTSYSETVYLFNGSKYINEGIALLLDFVQSPYFTDENVESEKGIIIQELKMYLDNPSDALNNGLLNNLFALYPLKYDIGGTVEEVKKITKDLLYKCYNTFYHPSNMHLVVVGNANPEEIANMVMENQDRKKFNPPLDIKKIIPVEDNIVKATAGSKKMEVVMPKVAFGIKLPFEKRAKNESIVLEILLKSVLELYIGSATPFYQAMLDEQIISGHIEYSVYIDEFAGFIRISANTERVDEFLSHVRERLLQIQKEEIDPQQFENIKRALIGNFIRGLNSLDYIATTYFEYLYRNCDMFEITTILDELTVEDAKKIGKYFNVDAMSSFTIYPKN